MKDLEALQRLPNKILTVDKDWVGNWNTDTVKVFALGWCAIAVVPKNRPRPEWETKAPFMEEVPLWDGDEMEAFPPGKYAFEIPDKMYNFYWFIQGREIYYSSAGGDLLLTILNKPKEECT